DSTWSERPISSSRRPGVRSSEVEAMERPAWAWMPVAALLISWAEPTARAAQRPAPPPAVPPPGHPDQSPAARPALPPAPPPPANPLESPGELDLPPALSGGAPGGGRAADPNPLATGLRLQPAPTGPADLRFPINLATALRLSDARPLVVAAAQAGVWVAE